MRYLDKVSVRVCGLKRRSNLYGSCSGNFAICGKVHLRTRAYRAARHNFQSVVCNAKQRYGNVVATRYIVQNDAYCAGVGRGASRNL